MVTWLSPSGMMRPRRKLTAKSGIRAFKVDVMIFHKLRHLVKMLDEYGQISVLVNNAGVTDTKCFTKCLKHNLTINNNLKSCFNASRAFILQCESIVLEK